MTGAERPHAVGVTDLAGKPDDPRRRARHRDVARLASADGRDLVLRAGSAARASASSSSARSRSRARERVVARAPTLLVVEDIAPDGTVLVRSDDWPTTMTCLPPGAAARGRPELAGLLDRQWICPTTDATSLFTERGRRRGGERRRLPAQDRTARRRPCASGTARARGACLRTGSGSSRCRRTGSSSSPSARASRGRSGTRTRVPGRRMVPRRQAASRRGALGGEALAPLRAGPRRRARRARHRARDSASPRSRRTGRSSSRGTRTGGGPRPGRGGEPRPARRALGAGDYVLHFDTAGKSLFVAG